MTGFGLVVLARQLVELELSIERKNDPAAFAVAHLTSLQQLYVSVTELEGNLILPKQLQQLDIRFSDSTIAAFGLTRLTQLKQPHMCTDDRPQYLLQL